jgi:hypothetical protein
LCICMSDRQESALLVHVKSDPEGAGPDLAVFPVVSDGKVLYVITLWTIIPPTLFVSC